MEHALTEMADYLLRQSWQIAAVFVVVAAASVLLRNASAHWRYLLWVVVLVKCLVPPIVTLPLAVLPERPDMQIAGADSPDAARSARLISAVEILRLAGPTSERLAQKSSATLPLVDKSTAAGSIPAAGKTPDALSSSRLSTIQWLAIGWLAGAVAFLLYALLKAGWIQRRLKRSRQAAPAELQTEAAQLARRLSLKIAPKVWLLEESAQPFVWGLLRGAIYLPADFQKNPPEHCRGILMHEIAHISRWDAAVNALQILVQGMLFFHPLVWWSNRKIRQEREKCCDEMAIAALSAQPKQYGSAIVETLIADRRTGRPVPSLAIAGPVKNIEERIKTIMHPNKKFQARPTWTAIVTVLILGVLAVPTALTLTAKSKIVQEQTPATQPAVQSASMLELRPAVTTDQIIVEDLALEILVAIREKDNAALKAMSVDRIKGWQDAWPHFSLELRERFTQMTDKPFTLYPASSIVSGDVAAVKCTNPKELKGGVYLALFFVKTDSGWKNFSIRNSPPSIPLETHLRKAAKEIGIQLSASQPATQSAGLLEGGFILEQTIPVGFLIGTKEHPQIVRIRALRFTRDGMDIKVQMSTEWVPVIDAKWRATLLLLDKTGKSLASASIIFNTFAKRTMHTVPVGQKGVGLVEVANSKREDLTLKIRIASDPERFTIKLERVGAVKKDTPQSSAAQPEALTSQGDLEPYQFGPKVDGVECKLRPNKQFWLLGQEISFLVDAQNYGNRKLYLFADQNSLLVEVDGHWYRRIREGALKWQDTTFVDFSHGQKFLSIPILLDESWKQLKDIDGFNLLSPQELKDTIEGAPLSWTPGKHTVRVLMFAWTKEALRRNGQKPVKFFSRPVSINIQ